MSYIVNTYLVLFKNVLVTLFIIITNLLFLVLPDKIIKQHSTIKLILLTYTQTSIYTVNANHQVQLLKKKSPTFTNSLPPWWWPLKDQGPPAAILPTTYIMHSRRPWQSSNASMDPGRDVDLMPSPKPVDTDANSPHYNCHYAKASVNSKLPKSIFTQKRSLRAIQLPKRGPTTMPCRSEVFYCFKKTVQLKKK